MIPIQIERHTPSDSEAYVSDSEAYVSDSEAYVSDS